MSKDNGKLPPGAPRGADEEGGALQMTITYDPSTGGTNITGPLSRPDLCYAMLGMAEQILLAQAVAKGGMKESSLIQVPRLRLG